MPFPYEEWRGRRAGRRVGALAVFVALLLASNLVLLWHAVSDRLPGIDRTVVARTTEPRGDLGEDEKATIALFERISPSVVHITSLAVRRDIWTLNLQEIPEGTGSGFVWDERGHVVTNYHVIQNADRASVTLSDQTTWEAAVVGSAPDVDLAILQIRAPEERLRPIPLGTSNDLKVGQKTFAIGNPFGLDQTLTTGVVSALDREIESVTRRPIRGVIQTDAAINPGNSGGPLLDSAGRLIGVNTAIYSPSGASAGIGFAIPAETVQRVVPELIRYGRVIRPGLGVRLAPDRIGQRLGVEGILVLELVPGAGAEKAGMRGTELDRYGRIRVLGDVVVSVEGKAVRTSNDLYLALQDHRVGDRVRVGVRRDDDSLEFDVVLQDVK